MGEPITFIKTNSSRPGTVRYEINRTLTGTDHERYEANQPIEDDRPVDQLAKDLFAVEGVASVHIYANMITLQLNRDIDLAPIDEIIEQLFIYYLPGVEVVIPEGAATD